MLGQRRADVARSLRTFVISSLRKWFGRDEQSDDGATVESLSASPADVVSPAQLQSSAIRGSLWITATTLANVPIALAGTIIAARELGPSAFGTFTLLMFVFPLALVVVDLGFGTAIGWTISSNSAHDREKVL